jgi:hypothetical protein
VGSRGRFTRIGPRASGRYSPPAWRSDSGTRKGCITRPTTIRENSPSMVPGFATNFACFQLETALPRAGCSRCAHSLKHTDSSSLLTRCARGVPGLTLLAYDIPTGSPRSNRLPHLNCAMQALKQSTGQGLDQLATGHAPGAQPNRERQFRALAEVW